MNKENLLPKHKLLFKQLRGSLTDEAFEIWYRNALVLKELPEDQWPEANLEAMPAQMFRAKAPTQVQAAISIAREAVSGYSPSNGARKAVEALADAIEQGKDV